MHDREDLADFLRSRRQRVSPESAGLERGARRRTPGLRRSEVAVLAGLSPTWYTYLEQARDVRPSGEVLDRLAEVLRLSEDERLHLHSLVHGSPARAAAMPTVSDAADTVVQLVAATAAMAEPVYALDRYADVIAMNPAADEWYPNLRAVGNALRWTVLDPAAPRVLVDWESEVIDVTARLRGVITRWGDDDDPRMRSMVEEFCRLNPTFENAWTERVVQEHRTRIRKFRRGGRQIELQLVIMTAADLGPRMIMFHLPHVPDDQDGAVRD